MHVKQKRLNKRNGSTKIQVYKQGVQDHRGVRFPSFSFTSCVLKSCVVKPFKEGFNSPHFPFLSFTGP